MDGDPTKGETEYRRRGELDVWHWRTDCPKWPAQGEHELLYSSRSRDQGMLCNQCRAKREPEHFGPYASIRQRADKHRSITL